ncbi:MAG: hypothetical protein NT067_02335 [Candidatus Diapherotrites archaeon]|nr:hypothetical protein [Candidatus Diapherotrites archaeon]
MAARSKRSVPRARRPSIPSRRPLWQTSNRPYPRTVFALHEPLMVYNSRAMEEFNRQHSRGEANVMWHADPKLVGKTTPYRNRVKSRGNVWFSPLRTPFSESVGEHYRLAFAKLENGFVVFKGSGTSNMTQLVPFTYRTYERVEPRKFWGGMTYGFAYTEAENAVEINNAFRDCRRRRKGFALEAGFLPTLEPLAIMKPLQVPRQSVSSVEKASMLKKKQSVLSRRLGGITIPKKVVSEQAVLVYKCQTPYRVRDLQPRLSPRLLSQLNTIVSGRKIALDRAASENAEQWLNLFEVHGFELRSEKGRLKIFEKDGKTMVSLRQARERIVDNFVSTLGSTIRIVHGELDGTFHSKRRAYSSMAVKDVSIAGQVFDLDCVRLHLKKGKGLYLDQGLDIDNAMEVVENFVNRLHFDKEDLAYGAIGMLKKTAKKKLMEIISG